MPPTVPVHRDRMDVNYSRWMSKDPNAEPDVIEDEPRRFSLPRPARSVVASGAMVALLALGGGALLRSIATPEVSTEKDQAVGTTTSDQSSGPGAAGTEDTEHTEDTEDSTLDGTESDDSAIDESVTVDEGTTIGDPELTGRRPERPWMARRELRRAYGLRPGPPPHVAPGPGLRHIDDADDADDDDDGS